MRHYWIMLSIIFLGGCIAFQPSAKERFFDKHYVLLEKDVDKLDGPYEVDDTTTNAVFARRGERKITIFTRGCVPTGVHEIDWQAELALATIRGGMGEDTIYLLKDATTWAGTNVARAIIYQPANQVCVGRDKKGEFTYRNLTYIMPQLLCLLEGELIVDNIDTNYPLYSIFVEVEKIAKKNKKGYWKNH